MTDLILEKFFEKERWTAALEKGVQKKILQGDLYMLTKEETRCAMYEAMRDGRYMIAPPHTAQIPKDNGEYRTVYVNEPIDRVVLSIANDLIFELMGDTIHSACKSYQKGVGCGKVVRKVSAEICDAKGETIGWKSDLSKYFDSVPIRFIDSALDEIEERYGKSALIKVIRDYYHSDLYFDKGELKEKYQSLKQGCAVAAYLADVIIRHIDEKLSSLDGYYVRYSDDMLFIGKDYARAMEILEHELSLMDMKLNPKKVEYLTHTKWFKFLGFSIKGSMISLSGTRLKRFQREIESRTVRKRDITFQKALNSVNNFLYKGDGKHSWATQILAVCNVPKDIQELNKFVMDCLRAVKTGKRKLGGLGYVANKEDGCVMRGIGRNVRANREKTGGTIDGYITLECMRKALLTRREAYRTLVSSL